MGHDLTHASFFSGVGGIDLGLERAGWRTISQSEIDPYAAAVLAERFPGTPNLGDILALDSYPFSATLWSGGFPCQDLSHAGRGRQRGMERGTRSGLAHAFLDLVERHRPAALFIENVQGLLSSNRGRDFGALVDRLGILGYGWAYRVFDAAQFDVPQRRRRVYVIALHTRHGFAADCAASVLAVGTRCDRHSKAGGQPRRNAADGTGAGFSRALSSRQERYDADTETFIISAPPDPAGMRTPDGVARRLDTGQRVAAPINANATGGWRFDADQARNLVADMGHAALTDDQLLPAGLDTHRYRCCGNGVVAPVAEWIGLRLAEVMT